MRRLAAKRVSADLAIVTRMATKDAKSIATDMLAAWTSGDFARTRALLHDDATVDGARGAPRGGDCHVEGVRGFARAIDRAELRVCFDPCPSFGDR